MNKTRRIFALIILIVFITTLLTAFISSADFDAKQLSDDIKNKAKQEQGGEAKGKMLEVGGKIIYAIKLVGLVLAIILIVWFGVQWMTANPQARAGLKDQAWNYVIGAVFLFGSGYIAKWVYDMVNTGIGNH